MIIASIYERNFSSIGSLQKAHTTKYCLTETTSETCTVYGISVVCEVGDLDSTNVVSSHIVQCVSNSRLEVMSILTYLYENCVESAVAPDVIADAAHCIISKCA